MRHLLLLALLLGLGGPIATAQTRPPARLASAADTLALSPPVPTDTATAIRRLYATRRQARTKILLLTGGGFLAAAGLGSIFGPEKYGSYGGNEVRIFNLALLAIPVLGVELIICGRYSHRNERFALQDLQAHKLSRSVKQDLDPKYFLPAK
jgi:hypothetical protein